MSTIDLEAKAESGRSELQDRRMVMDRRAGSGRRAMVRFDEKGGDRRSGYARRSTDLGFRELFTNE